MNPQPQTLLALHATMLEGLRAVVTQDNHVLRHRMVDCYAPNAWIPYLEENAERHPGLQIVVSPKDPWPPHLKGAIEDTGLPVRWVSSDFERTAYSAVANWSLNRKLYRARFLAFMYRYSRLSLCYDGSRAGKDWERHLAHETLEALAQVPPIDTDF